jgi:hypothetical protein
VEFGSLQIAQQSGARIPFKASTKFAQKKGFNKSATIMVRNPQEKEEQRILY